MEFTLFDNRFSTDYLVHLAELLENHEELCRYATAPGKDKTFHPGEKFTKGIQIDFCGLAATTLLGVSIKGENQSEERKRVARSFAKLLHPDTIKSLNNREEPIYLKIRFIFSYVYSTFSKSLIEAETALSRPQVRHLEDDRKIDYSFAIQSELSPKVIEDSTLFQCQTESLSRIATIVHDNPNLVMTTPESSENSLQVRFSSLAMPVCLMIINDRAYADPYLYAQENSVAGLRNLFYHYPVQAFDKKKAEEEKYFKYLTNHFDYQWNNEATMLCRDTTFFDLEHNYKGLSHIRKPKQLVFTQKENRIKDHLRGKKKEWQQKEIDKWKDHLVDQLSVYLATEEIGTKPPKKEKHDETAASPGLETALVIGRRSGLYYFKMVIPSQHVVIEYEKGEAERTYLVFLHAAIAAHWDKVPVMQRLHQYRGKIIGQIIKTMKNMATRNGQPFEIDSEFMLKYIFHKDKRYRLIANPKCVKIDKDFTEWAKGLTYPGANGEKYSVTNFDL